MVVAKAQLVVREQMVGEAACLVACRSLDCQMTLVRMPEDALAETGSCSALEADDGDRVYNGPGGQGI